ncbi:MAG TPA: hypothetical protein VIY08_15240 [Candidatus Nitrosocosmicus sp.]
MESNLDQVLKEPKRKLIVASNDIILNKNTDNVIFVLMVEESFGSAGGRGGGSGNRKIDKIMGFEINNNNTLKIFETEDENTIEKFEIPYNAVAMDIILGSGAPYVVQGITDIEMINEYVKITKCLI